MNFLQQLAAAAARLLGLTNNPVTWSGPKKPHLYGYQSVEAEQGQQHFHRRTREPHQRWVALFRWVWVDNSRYPGRRIRALYRERGISPKAARRAS